MFSYTEGKKNIVRNEHKKHMGKNKNKSSQVHNTDHQQIIEQIFLFSLRFHDMFIYWLFHLC